MATRWSEEIVTVQTLKTLVPNIDHWKCTEWGSFSAPKDMFQMSIPDVTKENKGKRKMSRSYEDKEQEKNIQSGIAA